MTVEDVIKFSKPHRNQIPGARQTRICDDRIEVSIVGGAKGLYGDFSEDFEIAVFDKSSNEFITRFFFPDNYDDVVPYLSGDKMIEFLNETFKKGFQVR